MRRVGAVWSLAFVGVFLGSPRMISAAAGAPELTPEQVTALNEAREQGRVLFQQRKYREAAEAYRRATRIDSSDAPTYFNLGLCHQGLNDSPGAVQALRRAITIDPMFGPAHLEIAKVLLKGNDLEAAEEEYKATQRLLADSIQYLAVAEQGLQNVAIAYTNRAVVAMRQRDYDRAQADAGRAMELAPELARGYYIGARIDEIRDRYGSALERYHLAAENAGNAKERAEALEGIGRVYIAIAHDAERANRTEEAERARRDAVEHLRESLQLDSTNATTFLNFGNTLYELNLNVEARNALIRAEGLNRRDYQAPFKLAEAYLKLDQCAEAEAAASRAIALQRANASVHAVRAEALECLGRLREAIEEYDQARRDPRWRQRAEYKMKKLTEELGRSVEAR